jgi:hypothetical protein
MPQPCTTPAAILLWFQLATRGCVQVTQSQDEPYSASAGDRIVTTNRDGPGELLDQAMSQLRQGGSMDQLAILANKTGQLLGVLRWLGDQHGTAMPSDVVMATYGLRRWSLAMKDGLSSHEATSARNAD